MEMDHGQGELSSMTGTTSSVVYNDDEAPVKPPPGHASRSGVLILNMYSENPAVPNGADHNGFAVMVHVKAPSLVVAEPLDLVAVLDVSESMAGAKLAQVKRAMGFVVDRLGPRDRLSVVALSDGARRVIRLTCMTEDGKAAAKRAVEALEASIGSTNLRAGLDEAAKVLDGSRRRNDVASVILVSGGRQGNTDTGDCNDVLVLVPPFLRPDWGSGYRRTPVHTFLLGSESESESGSGHNAAAAMHNISEVTGGTFSFVEDHAVIQDALAQCIGGLLSVTAKDACVEIKCAMFPQTEDMLKVTAVKAGRCVRSESLFEEGWFEEGWVDVGQLYADEERRILCFLDVPAEDNARWNRTRLINVRCSYDDVASEQPVRVETADFGEDYITIMRPLEATDMARCVEVERELLRVAAVDDMALAREAAERGAYAEAARILDARRESLSRSAPALSGDAMCTALVAELHELSQRVSDELRYRRTGRPCILASMSSHSLQRGSSTVRFGCSVVGSTSVFATSAMQKMEKLSEMLRTRQEMPPRLPLPENGSKTVPPRSRLEARLASAVPRLSMVSRYRRLLLKR